MPVLTPATLWPPLVKVCISWLHQQLPDVPVVYDTSKIVVAGSAVTLDQAVNLAPGVIQVIRTPGGGASNDLDEYASIDLYFYAKDADSVESLAQQGHSKILQLRSAAGWLVDEVHTESSPGEVPYSNPTVQRWVGSYGLTCMPQR